jgi:hypothetical protein
MLRIAFFLFLTTITALVFAHKEPDNEFSNSMANKKNPSTFIKSTSRPTLNEIETTETSHTEPYPIDFKTLDSRFKNNHSDLSVAMICALFGIMAYVYFVQMEH